MEIQKYKISIESQDSNYAVRDEFSCRVDLTKEQLHQMIKSITKILTQKVDH